jgi:hypothetical protein
MNPAVRRAARGLMNHRISLAEEKQRGLLQRRKKLLPFTPQPSFFANQQLNTYASALLQRFTASAAVVQF